MSSAGRVSLAEMLDLITVERLVLDPGDILVLKVPGALSADETQELRERCDAAMPKVPVLVLDRSIDMNALRARP